MCLRSMEFLFVAILGQGSVSDTQPNRTCSNKVWHPSAEGFKYESNHRNVFFFFGRDAGQDNFRDAWEEDDIKSQYAFTIGVNNKSVQFDF